MKIEKKNQEIVSNKNNKQELFLYLGNVVALDDLIETEGLDREIVNANLLKFYSKSCKKIVAERLKIYQNKLNVKPKSVDIIASRTKWGTCNSDKKITFNLRLVMAPIEIIDYVVVHELCHLIHMNHDRSFWRPVGSVLPDYKKRQGILAEMGQSITP